MMISIKRNNLIKAYSNYEVAVKEDDIDKKDSLFKKYEEAYSLYLEAIDKYIMDSVYKKVKNNTASELLILYYVKITCITAGNFYLRNQIFQVVQSTLSSKYCHWNLRSVRYLRYSVYRSHSHHHMPSRFEEQDIRSLP